MAVPGPPDLARLHAKELPQKDHLCGAFWGALALQAAGFREADGGPVDQDLVALRAGTTIAPGDDDALPPGASPRVDYRLELEQGEPATSGTAASGLARAVGELSGGRLAVVPVAGPWTAESVVGLAEGVAAAARDATLVANLRTGRLWGTSPPAAALVAYLAGEAVVGPPSEWDVGHFVTLAAVLSGPGGALVCVRDTYPTLGWGGYHLQPAGVVAAALERGDGREGGVLCIAPAEAAAALRERLAEAGYELRLWDNGSADRLEEA